MSDDDLIRRGDAVAVLRKAQISSCTCQIKTPDPDWHRHDCRYRILREAEAMIDHVSPFPATDAREKALHPDDMLPEAIRLIRQEATRDHSQDVVTGLKHIALLLEQLINEARDERPN